MQLQVKMETLCALNKPAQISSLADCPEFPDDLSRMNQYPDRILPDDSAGATRKQAQPGLPDATEKQVQAVALPREIGGRGGLEPTRYGDWEKNGRCIDF